MPAFLSAAAGHASSTAAADTVLAFDFGLRRIGVAVGNRLTGGARPLAVVQGDNDSQRFEAIGRLISEWTPQRLVVGHPRHPDGAAHAMTARSERFARQLEGRFRLPVTLVDERYSSAEAEAQDRDARARASAGRGRAGSAGNAAHQRRHASLDAEAAAIILRQYWSEAV
jgi:putative Holliday junction resolvase